MTPNRIKELREKNYFTQQDLSNHFWKQKRKREY